MIVARMRISNDGDRFLSTRFFAEFNAAQAWCLNSIGLSTGEGLIEYISLTDYSTMTTEEFEV